MLPGFRDIGPREWTHRAGDILSVRLDRCMARGLQCVESWVSERGPSDHHPIILDLIPAVERDVERRILAGRSVRIPNFAVPHFGQWVRTMSRESARSPANSPERTTVPARLAKMRARRRARKAARQNARS
jgi:hypothetical protein